MQQSCLCVRLGAPSSEFVHVQTTPPTNPELLWMYVECENIRTIPCSTTHMTIKHPIHPQTQIFCECLHRECLCTFSHEYLARHTPTNPELLWMSVSWMSIYTSVYIYVCLYIQYIINMLNVYAFICLYTQYILDIVNIYIYVCLYTMHHRHRESLFIRLSIYTIHHHRHGEYLHPRQSI